MPLLAASSASATVAVAVVAWRRRLREASAKAAQGSAQAFVSARPAEVVDVVVIGAGFAGLACGTSLSDRGVSSMCVVEARDRPGGRVRSRPGAVDSGAVVELGAEFIHGQHVATWRYLQRFGLTGCDRGCSGEAGVSTLEGGRNYAYLGGRLLPPDEVRAGKVYFGPIESAIGAWVSGGGDTSISVGELVRRSEAEVFGGPPSKEERQLCEGMMAEWYAADLDDVSILEDLPEVAIPDALKAEPELLEEDGEEGHWRVKEGYSALAERMAASLAGKIRYSSEVVKVDWSVAGGGVAVHVRHPSGAAHVILAHCAIVTVPLACLQQGAVAFEPRLPEWKQKAIDAIGSGKSYKVSLNFERAFWPEDMHFLFSPFSMQVWWGGCAGDNCLMGYAGGDDALRLLERPDSEVIDEALRQLTDIFAKSGQEASLPMLTSAEVVRWPEDPWARMGYSYQRVGCPNDARLRLREPCWPLLWAGEACHPTKSAMVHGALETGERAAAQASDGCAYEVINLRHGHRELFDEVYQDFLVKYFDHDGELDDVNIIRAGLDIGNDRDPEVHLLVARSRAHGGELAGILHFEYYPTAACALMSYFAVAEAHRRRRLVADRPLAEGVSRRLLQRMEFELLARTGGRRVPIFAETRHAELDDGTMPSKERHQALAKLGFRRLAFDYVQPPISPDDGPVEGLHLLVKDRASLPADAVVAYLDGFAGSTLAWDERLWKKEPYYLAQVRQLRRWGQVPSTDRTPW